jgi:hypothetical protein
MEVTDAAALYFGPGAASRSCATTFGVQDRGQLARLVHVAHLGRPAVGGGVLLEFEPTAQLMRSPRPSQLSHGADHKFFWPAHKKY